MIEVVKMRKSYGAQEVLEIDHLKIDKGIVLFKGANGAGKSTFLQAIAGLVAFSGEIFIGDGISIRKEPLKYRRYVNYSEAEPIYPGFLTAQELLNLFSSAKSGNLKQQSQFMELMGMTPYLDYPIMSFSSGMLKKLSVALAFTGIPQVVLLDEPFNALDETALKTLCTLIAQKYSQEGTTFLIASHQELPSRLLPITHTFIIENRNVKKA